MPTSIDVREHVRPGPRSFGFWLLALAACAAPPPVSLELEGARESLEARRDPAVLEEALALAPLPPSLLTLPPEDQRARPHQRGYWLVQALAFAPEVRAARRELRATQALTRSAGAPGPVQVQLVDHEFGGDDELLEAVAVFDLIGLLGLGPAQAERQVAAAEEALALAALERTAWEAWLRVERARVRCVAAVLREERLVELAEDARTDLARVEILERNGRLSHAAASNARAAVESIERLRSQAVVATEDARAGLALVAGISLGDEMRQPGDLEPLPAAAGTAIENHPRLREAWLRFAVREAEVRRAAAAAWPGIQFGPHLSYNDDFRLGGVLRVSLPFPSGWRGRLGAALERRDGAIEAFEDVLHALNVGEEEARQRRVEIEGRLVTTESLQESADDGWRATRSAFRVGRMDVPDWTDAVERAGRWLTADVEDAEVLAIASLDLVAARGPGASPFRPQDGPEPTEVTP